MDALQLLIGDHNRVKGLFTRFKDAHEADDQATAQEAATRLFRELDVHTQLEETVFYPAVQAVSDEIHDLVVEGLEEHQVAKELIAEARDTDPSNEHWAAKVKVLIESVEHHVEEEEGEMFTPVRKALSPDQLEALGQKMEATKRGLGEPTVADVIDLTKTELETLAKEQQIPGRSKMSRDELAASVSPR